jgi:glycosyltransferase involved in cell wall biosynthesis
MTPQISVIIPSYNYGRYIGGTIESVLRQTFADWELLIIDDGSTDQTRDVVQPYLDDERVSFHPIDHGGVSAAKNAGIQMARGAFVAILDADDRWLPTKLEKQLSLFGSRPELGVVYSRRLLIDAQGRPLQYTQPTLYRGNILEAIFQTNFVCQSTAMIRRDVFEDVGLFDERYPPVEDYDLWLRIARWYPFDYVDEPLVEYRVGHASLSTRYADRLLIALEIMERFLSDQRGRELISPATVRTAKAETLCHLSLAKRPYSSLAALRFNLKGLAASPGYLPAWKALASLPLPERGRRLLRRLLGKPVDWERKRVTAA